MNIAHFTDERIAKIYEGDPLTPAEREFLIYDTARFEECCYYPAQLSGMDDPSLMKLAYGVWADYASTQ